MGSNHLDQLLEAAYGFGRLLEVVDGSPGHLSHVDVALGVQTDAVGRDELADFQSRPLVTYSSQTFSAGVHHGDSGSDAGQVAVHGRTCSQLPYVNVLLRRDTEAAGPVKVVPLRLELAIGVEYLYPVAFSVGHVHVAVFVRDDVVR